MKSQNDLIKQLGEIALGSRFKRLSDRFMNEVFNIYKAQKIDFEPKWFALTYYLYENDSASILELAASLGFSHPAIIQLINQMGKKKLIETFKDNNDKRKTMVKLTNNGRALFNSLQPLLSDIEGSIKEIIHSTGYDVLHVVESVEKTLDEKNLQTRTLEKTKKRMLDSVEILRYSSKYKESFRNLNYEWLEKYFNVEPADERLLSDPDKYIIEKGGEIFFARDNGEIVGTCAAIKIDKRTYELAKMAVTGKFQGKQIGKKLALAVIGFAYSKGAKTIILETNHKLQTAIKLYESLGFKYSNFNTESKYERQTFQMILEL
jgi:DNA-binding MarR family transcriptional regulator/N-acetylglutamate synthase-like GNAT family acetyltransferase